MEQRYEDDITIELRELFVLIWKRIPIILVSALVVSFCAFLVTKLNITTTYTLEQKICLVMEIEDFENIQGKLLEGEFSLNKSNLTSDINTSLIVNDCVELMRSSQILNPVIEELDLDLTLCQLQEMLSIGAIGNSRIIFIRIESENKKEVKQIVNAIKQKAHEKLPQLLEVERVIDVDEGKILKNSNSSDLKKNTLVGAVLGAFLAMCIILWLFIFDDKIKSAEDIERHLKLNILGVVTSSGMDSDKEAYRTLRTNIQFATSSSNKVLACVNYVSGIKNEVAKSLAVSMAEAGRKVLFINADMRRSEAERKGLVHYLSEQAEIKDIIVEEKNLAIIASGASALNSTELLDNIRFEELIQEVKNRFDYIIIDTPPIENAIDGVIVAGKSDVAVVIIEEKSVNQNLAKHLQKQLEISGCPLLGAVFLKK